MSIKEHEENYWHIRKFGFKIPLLVIYMVSTGMSIMWILFSLNTNEPTLAIPMVIMALGLATGWLLAVDKIFT